MGDNDEFLEGQGIPSEENLDIEGLQKIDPQGDFDLDTSESIQHLAASFAPQVEELDALLNSGLDFAKNEKAKNGSFRHDDSTRNEDITSTRFDDDYLHNDDCSDRSFDSMDRELNALTNAQEMLQQELELAKDFASFFEQSTPSKGQGLDLTSPLPIATIDDETESSYPDESHASYPSQGMVSDELTNQGAQKPLGDSKMKQEETAVEAKNLLHANISEEEKVPKTEKSGLHSSPETPQHPPIQASNSSFSNLFKRNPVGRNPAASMFAPLSPTTTHIELDEASENKSAVIYTYAHHQQSLRIQKEPPGAWYSIDLTQHLLPNLEGMDGQNTTEVLGRRSTAGIIKEYCLTMLECHRFYQCTTDENLKDKNNSKNNNDASATEPTSKPPVRTIAIRIRPDVLCGAVMDALHHTLYDTDSEVHKRQGGHLQATIHLRDENNFESFDVDAQICTYSSEQCERMLLIRIYHVSDTIKQEVAPQPNNDLTHSSHNSNSLMSSQGDLSIADGTKINQTDANMHLREACALIQRMESSNWQKMGRALKMSRELEEAAEKDGCNYVDLAQHFVSQHLLQNYRACPSVMNNEKKTRITLPALSPTDWPIICSSWLWITAIWEELHDRQLTYASLWTNPFGNFPALPTLDVHYCAQLKTYSRKQMVQNLITHAAELEDYAQKTEMDSYHGWTLLQGAIQSYKVKLPGPPVPISLAAYPLDFKPHQALCPPWGTKVMEALNLVSAMSHGDKSALLASPLFNDSSVSHICPSSAMDSLNPESDGNRSIDMAEKAVLLVWTAFQKQHDEEQSARLDRKNAQIMDRLSRLHQYQRKCVKKLSKSDHKDAVRAGNDFANKIKPENLTSISIEDGVREVPLLSCSIMVGNTTGSCFVTASQILLTTSKWIPLLGTGARSTLLKLSDIELEIVEEQSYMFQALQPIISVKKSGEEVFTFRPSWVAGTRLKSLVETLKNISSKAVQEYPERLSSMTQLAQIKEKVESKAKDPKEGENDDDLFYASPNKNSV